MSIEGVVSYSNVHLWQLKSVLNVASLHIQVANDANDQGVRQKAIKILKSANISQASVQVYCLVVIILNVFVVLLSKIWISSIHVVDIISL